MSTRTPTSNDAAAESGDALRRLEERIGYTFRDKSLLTAALTHSSFSNENRTGAPVCNERLEFLGDSVLGMIAAQYLFTHYAALPEGELTKLRAAIVCEDSLAVFARQISLGEALRLGRGERQAHGEERASLLSDAFEALLAAMYLDSSLERVRTWLLPFLTPAADTALRGQGKDFKTLLQELVQRGGGHLAYQLISAEGPDHAKHFTVAVTLGDKQVGLGSGHSKKEAEQRAAALALQSLGGGTPEQG